MPSANSNLQSLSFCNLTHPLTHGRNIPLSVLDQLHLPALSIGLFPSQELDHLFHWHSFFPLYYSILLFFFQLKEKDKKNCIFQKRVGTGQHFHILLAARVSCVSLEKSTQKKVSPPFGWDLVWLRYTLTLLLSQFSSDWLSLPIIWRVHSCLLHDGLIQSYHMLPHSHHWFMLLFKGSKSDLASSRCLLTYFSVGHPLLSVSCLSSHQLYWSFTRAGLRRSPLTSCWWVLFLSTMTYCSEGRPRAAL